MNRNRSPQMRVAATLRGVSAYTALIALIALIAIIAGGAGCRLQEPVVDVGFADGPLVTSVDLSAYLPNLIGQTRYFRRRSVHRRSTEEERYAKQWHTWGRAEGLLAGLQTGALGHYFGANKPQDGQSPFPWPKLPAGKGDAFFLEFDPPLIEWPLHLSPLRPRTQQSRVQSYGPKGNELWEGTATRTLTFQGFADVHVGGRRYAHCAVVHSETTMSFGFWFRVVLSEWVWLAEGLGVVQRRERFSGSLLVIIPFASAYVYELADAGELPAHSNTGDDRIYRQHQVSAWHRAAVLLDRVLPAPRIAGLIVETSAEN